MGIEQEVQIDALWPKITNRDDWSIRIDLAYNTHMQQTSSENPLRSLIDYTYIAIYIFNILFRFIAYAGLSDACHGSGGMPYIRFCAQAWWYFLIFIPDLYLSFV